MFGEPLRLIQQFAMFDLVTHTIIGKCPQMPGDKAAVRSSIIVWCAALNSLVCPCLAALACSYKQERYYLRLLNAPACNCYTQVQLCKRAVSAHM